MPDTNNHNVAIQNSIQSRSMWLYNNVEIEHCIRLTSIVVTCEELYFCNIWFIFVTHTVGLAIPTVVYISEFVEV